MLYKASLEEDEYETLFFRWILKIEKISTIFIKSQKNG